MKLDPRWSQRVVVASHDGSSHVWHVLDSGTAPDVGTLLCVHGNPTWSYLWRRLVAAPPPGWRVLAPDQLGMGFSARLDAPRSYADRVRDLADLTTALGVDGAVVTVGHDWGGAISLGWALAHRDRLRGVVLTNTAVAQPPGDHGPLLIRLAHLRAVRSLACVRTPLFVAATSRISRPPLARSVRRALAAPYRSPARRQAVGDFVADIPFVPGHPSEAAVAATAEGLRTLDVPALLMWGPRDPVFGERYLRDLRQRLPHAVLHRFEGAGHLVTEDAPAYVDVVRDWVADLAPVSRRAPGGPSSTSGGEAVPSLVEARPEEPRDEASRRELAQQASRNQGAPASARRLWSALAERADDPSPAVVEVGGATVSWADLAARVDAGAGGLTAAGLRPGDRVGLLVQPSIDLTVAVYACWRAGGVVVVADQGLGFTGMRRALRGASLDWVVGGAPGLAAARAMGLPVRADRLVAAGLSTAVGRMLGAGHTLAGLAAAGGPADLAAAAGPPPPEPPADAECAVLFTSGATGPAKGVVYRHGQAAAQMELVRTAYDLDESDRMVAAFAPFALLGPALGVGSVVPDIDVTQPGTLTAAQLAAAVTALDATVVFASPAALRNVVATAGHLSPDAAAALDGVRLLMSAGAPVPVSLLAQVAEVLPKASLHTPYGMTEALPVTDVSYDGIRAAGPGVGVCVGRPLPGVRVRVAPLAPADATPIDDADVLGELCVAGPHVKDHYDALWATERAASRHSTPERGWHRTGDVGHLDETGRVWVEGRLAHVVTAPDGVVTPVPVEQRIEELTSVSAAAVVGVGPTGTQAVVAVVVPTVDAPRALAPAPLTLVDAVRTAAGLPLAAVLITPALPVDIRHQSKVDRIAIAHDVAGLLS